MHEVRVHGEAPPHNRIRQNTTGSDIVRQFILSNLVEPDKLCRSLSKFVELCRTLSCCQILSNWSNFVKLCQTGWTLSNFVELCRTLLNWSNFVGLCRTLPDCRTLSNLSNFVVLCRTLSNLSDFVKFCRIFSDFVTWFYLLLSKHTCIW